MRDEPVAAYDASAAPSAEVHDASISAPVTETATAAASALPNITTDWCLDGWRGLDESTCYLVPDDAAPPPRRLLIYLSGIVPPIRTSPQKEAVFHVVSSFARKANVVAMLPRGRRGIGPGDSKDWWAWPTGTVDYEKYHAPLVLEWQEKRAKLEAAIGQRFTKVYLAGSSSGAYFLAALALSGDADFFDGYAAASGGATNLSPRHAVTKKPFYVGYAEGDPSNGGPKALATFLSAAGWPVRVQSHAGGHGAREEYLNEAFAFWTEYEATH